MPPARTVVGGELHSTHLGCAKRAALGVELESVAKQTRRDPNDYATDVEYRDFLSRYKQLAFNPGLNVIFRLATEF